MSRTKKSLKNIEFSLIFQSFSTLTSFLTRRVFIQMLTKEYLGLDGTFSNILSMLSLAELGVGSAITYSLYKPLAEQDQEQIAALMALFRRVYRTIGLVVAAAGLALTPFLPQIIHNLPDIPKINLIYALFVFNTSLSYFYVYKQTLLIADQQQYIVTTVHYVSKIILSLTQMLFLWLTRNYFVFLGLQIGVTLLENLLLSRRADRLYPYINELRPKGLDAKTKNEIVRNTRAMITHKVGGVVVFGTDNLLISYFVGVVAVGLYSNYLMVTNGLSTVYGQLFNSLVASVGNLGATEDAGRALPVFWKINFAGTWLYGFSAVCLVVLLNPFISLWVGEEYLFSQGIVILIALNFYVMGMRQSVLAFRNAYGLYWYDRYKPVAESVVNLVVSILLAIPFGVAGILAGTFISTMTTCFWIEPVVLFRYGMHTSVKRYFREYILNTAVTLLTTVVVWFVCAALPGTGVMLFVGKMAVCAVAGNLGYLLTYCRREEFRYFVGLLAGFLHWRT